MKQNGRININSFTHKNGAKETIRKKTRSSRKKKQQNNKNVDEEEKNPN